MKEEPHLLDLLAIAPHPDDAELTCGGTLLKAAEQGYKTGILDLTAGDMGTRGTPETRLKEAAKAARILRLSHRENLRLPDARLAVTEDYKLAVARRIRALKPHTVILPYWEGRHPDHYTTSRLCYEACFLAGLKQLPIEGEPFRPFKILYATAYHRVLRPTFVVDITPYFQRKFRSIVAYHSQFHPKAEEKKWSVEIRLDRLQKNMKMIGEYYGHLAGVQYAEGFFVKEVMEVDDVVNLPVRSI